MKRCIITVMKVARYDDLIEKYENPIEHACDMKEGQVFIANGWDNRRSLIGEQPGIASLNIRQGIVCALLTQRLLSFRFIPIGCLKSERLI